MNDLHHFKAFLTRREQAANRYVNGDAAPLSALVAKQGSASFFGPGGGVVEGADVVRARYEKDAGGFVEGSDSHFEILDVAANDGLAWWVGFQHANARFKGKPDPVPMKLRITELFRRDGDDWVLVHRHADSLAEAKPV